MATDKGSGEAALRVLAAGVDSVYASARGELQNSLITLLGELRSFGNRDGMVLSFREDEGHFLLRPHGWRGYPHWLGSPRFELMIGAADPFPPVYLELHSSFVHTFGVEDAVEDARRFVEQSILTGCATLTPSRIDLYADMQGWQPRLQDFDRFVCRGVRRRVFEQPRELHAAGRVVSGFMFGKGHVVGRIYNKSLEMRMRGSSWQETLWEEQDAEQPVWRVEFQFRRKGLTSRGIRTMDQALAKRQDLWEYGTRWLSLRAGRGRGELWRQVEDDVWLALRQAQLGSPRSGLIRERIRGADRRRLVSGFAGYASSLAALSGDTDVQRALLRLVPAVEQHLAERGTPFHAVVNRKRALRSATREAIPRGEVEL